jgi:C4-dicarboxylate-specific signal transduction histidine kinase
MSNPMRRLRDTPIQRKLTLITMLTSGVALLLACLAFMTYELVVFRGSMVNDASTTAAMLADNTSSALAFNDPASAEQTLKSVSAHPNVVGAVVYDGAGRVFATYRRANLPEPFDLPSAAEPDGHRFDGSYLKLFSGIKLAGERAGTVYIQSDLNEMWARLKQYVLIVLLVMIAASIVTFFLSRKLQSAISAPLSHLAGIVGVVAKHRDYSVRAVKQGEDELGQLIEGFNEMLNQIQTQDSALQEAHHTLEKRVAERTAELQNEVVERKQAQAEIERIHGQLLAASRQAGMAEVATNVLHNVGNVLNSVNVSANLIATHVQQSKVPGLARVVTLLREHEHDLGTFIVSDARGKHLSGHLANLSEHLQAEQAATVKELDSLRANIEHIKDIVSMQQNYAKVAGVKEIVNVVDLVEDSLRMNAGALTRHRVEVVRDFQTRPTINIDKHKVLQILVNLVRNAKYACEESQRPDRLVTLRVAQVEERVEISVIDNGVGIGPENLTRIFNHGFTTRASGHGFGLHSGALAARELDGSLTAHSEGVGRGARFTLALPLQAEAARADPPVRATASAI